MAIQRAYITPEPEKAFLASFNQADASARDYARLQMERERMAQQMEQRAVDKARQERADDVNLMMRALGRQDAAERLNLTAAYQKATLDNARYNAETSRMRQETNDRRQRKLDASIGDPLGFETGGGSSLPELPVEGGFVPADGIEPGADLFTPSVDGEGINEPLITEPPPDMGEVAAAEEFEVPGAEGSEGPAGPDGAAAGGKPPITWTAPVDPRMVASEYAVPGAEGPAGSPGVPADEDLLPPPVLDVPSLDSADLSQEARKDLYKLHRDNASLMQEARQANSRAATINAAIPRANNKALYRQKAEEAQKIAQEKAAAAQENHFKIAENTRNAAMIQKRQEAIGAIAHLGDVLPAGLQKDLISEAKDPRSGAVADRKIAALAAYDKVRQAEGLSHKSRSFETAQQVARQGMLLQTEDAKDERKAANTYESYRSLLQANKALEATNPDRADEDTEKEWRKEMNKNLALANQWKARRREFDTAVKADTLPEAPTIEEPAVPGAPRPGAAPAAPAAKPAFQIPDTYDPDRSAALEDTAETWTAIKSKYARENPGVIDRVRAIVEADPMFRGEELRNEFLTKDDSGRTPVGLATFARVGRTGPNKVTGFEVIEAIARDMRRKNAVTRAAASPPPTIGGWKITPVGAATD